MEEIEIRNIIESLSKDINKLFEKERISSENIPVVERILDYFMQLPDFIEDELTPYHKICYIEKTLATIPKDERKDLRLKAREYQVSLFPLVDDEQVEDYVMAFPEDDEIEEMLVANIKEELEKLKG